jgi:hypothetical protein
MSIDYNKAQYLAIFQIIGNHQVAVFSYPKNLMVSDFLINVPGESFIVISEMSHFATWGWMHLHDANLSN